MKADQWEFKIDPKTPKRVALLFLKQELSRTDLLLSWIINSMVKTAMKGNEHKSRGCFATNDRLATLMDGLHPKHVQRSLTKLKSKGLLIVVHYQNRRYLEMEWSRTAEERSAISGGYGRVLRQAHKDLVTALDRSVKNDIVTKMLHPSNIFVTTPSNKNVTHKHKKEETQEKETLSLRDGVCGVPPSFNGQSPPRPSKEARRLAIMLWNKVNTDFPDQVDKRSHLDRWIKDFAALEQTHGAARVRAVLEAHVANMGTKDDKPRYWPDAYSPRGFADKWAQITRAIDRKAKSPAGDEGKVPANHRI